MALHREVLSEPLEAKVLRALAGTELAVREDRLPESARGGS